MKIRHEPTGAIWSETDDHFLFAWQMAKTHPDIFTVVCTYPQDYDKIDQDIEEYVKEWADVV